MDTSYSENKVRHVDAKIKKGMSTLIGNSATQPGQLEGNFYQTANKTNAEINSWIENNALQLQNRYKKLTNHASNSMYDTAYTVINKVDDPFSPFNAKAEEVANIVPGRLGKRAAQYPYVAISIAVIFGFLIGNLLLPARQSMHRELRVYSTTSN